MALSRRSTTSRYLRTSSRNLSTLGVLGLFQKQPSDWVSAWSDEDTEVAPIRATVTTSSRAQTG